MLILGLLCMYFDAVVVEVKTILLLFRLALAILWHIACKKFQGRKPFNIFVGILENRWLHKFILTLTDL